ncbi:18072_t:CDS:2, partial [Dentiscutata erythropus]
HNIATLNFEDLCHLVELQIQNTKNSIIPGGANLLSLPESITTVQSTRSEYGSYANYVSVSEVTMQVNAIIESITTDFIGTTNVQPTFGTILLQFMNQNDILPNDLLSFIYEFTENTVTNIKLHFPDHEITVVPGQLPYSISVYGNHKINKIGNFYGISKKIAGSKNFFI